MEDRLFFDKVYGCLVAGLIGDAMGAPTEDMHYLDIEKKYGEVSDFEGAGTDDSIIKHILCAAILENDGYVTADEFAAAFVKDVAACKSHYDYFYVPVRNAFHKFESGTEVPVYAGMGNMPSSSTAMSISPMGILNACNPRQAALETYDVAGFIHGGNVSTFCRDGACAIAATVAEAMKPSATVESILEAAVIYLHKLSSAVMLSHIEYALEHVRTHGDYRKFRDDYYKKFHNSIINDSRETVSCALALFALAQGEPNQAIIFGANFGRDSDTIGTMVGSICGAFKGASAIRKEWLDKIEADDKSQYDLARRMMEAAKSKAARMRADLRLLAE